MRTARIIKPYLIIIAVFIIIIILARIIWLIAPGWSGFGDKTFWDLLSLLIIPVSLAILAIWFNQQSSNNARELAKEQYIESSFQKYFDNISQLILDRELLTSDEDHPSHTIAWQRTVAVTRILDEERKSILLDFLYYTDLIYNKKDSDPPQLFSVVNLYNADFSKIDYKGSFLNNTHLRGAIFEGANLTNTMLRESNLEDANFKNCILDGCDFLRANLHGTNLSGASLRNADFTLADLQGAIVSEKQLNTVKTLLGSILPNGEIYDGRFNLIDDLDSAKAFDVDISDKHALMQWYQSARKILSESDDENLSISDDIPEL